MRNLSYVIKTFCLFFFIGIAVSTSAQHNKDEADKKALKSWLKTNIKLLKTDTSLATLPLTEPFFQEYSDHVMISYRIYQRTRIRCANGDWIYFVTHSSHVDSKIGDVCLAITQNRKTWVNYGHVCGGMIHFISHKGNIPATPDDFFRDFVSDVDDKKWMKIK